MLMPRSTRRRILLTAVTAAATMLTAVSLPRQSIASGSPREDPPVLWLVIGGGGAPNAGRAVGLVLSAPADSPTTITLALNSSTGAQGRIAMGDECGEQQHYHGTLFGADDGGQGSGWGVAVPFAAQPEVVQETPKAILIELGILQSLESQPPNYPAAAASIRDAIGQLNRSIRAVQGSRIKKKKKKAIIDRLEGARSKDQRARDIIDRLQMGQGGEPARLAAIVNINQALEQKRDAFNRILGALGLRPDPDGD